MQWPSRRSAIRRSRHALPKTGSVQTAHNQEKIIQLEQRVSKERIEIFVIEFGRRSGDIKMKGSANRCFVTEEVWVADLDVDDITARSRCRLMKSEDG